MAALIDTVAAHGVYAVFALMALDALLPVGGEAVMLYAGALPTGVVGGHVPTLFGVTLHADAPADPRPDEVAERPGERHGRWLHLGPQRLRRAEVWFERHGHAAVFVGRLTPFVRSFISVTAGVLRSPFGVYSALTLLGSAIWCFGFAAVGRALGDNYEQADSVAHVLELAAVVVLAICAITVLLRRRRARAVLER